MLAHTNNTHNHNNNNNNDNKNMFRRMRYLNNCRIILVAFNIVNNLYPFLMLTSEDSTQDT